MMLIDPASNVSVPFTVVMRTRSKVPERAVLTPAARRVFVLVTADINKLKVQMFEPNKQIVAIPEFVELAPIVRNSQPEVEFMPPLTDAAPMFP